MGRNDAKASDHRTTQHLTPMLFAGPPGTGKTVVLMLKAGQWLTEGHDVHVVSLYRESIAASCYIYEALSQKYSSGQVGGYIFVIASMSLSP